MAFKLVIKYVLVLAWMTLIFVLSHQGHQVSSGQSMGVVQAVEGFLGVGLPETVVRKTAHLLLYAVLGALMFVLVSEYTTKRHRAALVGVGLVCLYAVSDELHQFFVPGRSGQVSDVAIDTLGGVVGVLCCVLVVNLVDKVQKHKRYVDRSAQVA